MPQYPAGFTPDSKYPEGFTPDPGGVSKYPSGFTPDEEDRGFFAKYPRIRELGQRLLTGSSPESEEQMRQSAIQKLEESSGEFPSREWLYPGSNQKELERLRGGGNVRIIGTPESEGSILPRMGENQETYMGGFLRSLYNDFVVPLGSPSGALGMSTPRGIARFTPPKNIPRIIPGTTKKAQKLLPAGRGEEPFIGGPAGGSGLVEPKSNVTPQVEEFLGSGQSTYGRAGDVPPKFADLDTLREQERLKALNYTDFELQGGKALDIPDRPIMEAPSTSGETGMGFSPTARTGGLPYPLDFMPEAVRPRSTQEVTRALGGERFSSPLREGEPIGFGNELPPKSIKPKVPLRDPTRALEPGEPIMPSALKSAAKKARENTKLNIDEMAVESAPSQLREPLAKLIAQESKMPSPWRSTRTVLNDLSPELARRDKRAVQITRQYDAQYVPEFEKAVRGLTNKEKENLGAYVEGSVPITSPSVQKAVNIWKQIESSIGDEASRVGLRLFTEGKKFVPFQKNTQNYWPHIPKERLAEAGLRERLMDSGMTRAEAERVIKHYQKEGELIIGPQHARKVGSEIPYRLDADVGITHIRAMSKRMAQHREFGPMDIAGKGIEGIADLIEATKDPDLALKIMKRLIGREEKSNPILTKWLDRSRKYAALTKLQNFTLPNMILGQGPTSLKGSSYPIEAGKEIFKLFSKRYRDDLAKSGIWQNFSHTLAEEMSHLDPYLIGAGETFNRGIAGAVGKAVAREAHRELRRNPNSARAAKELGELVLEDINKLVSQDQLTNNQLNMAAGRMAETTQGLNVPGNLPFWASDPLTGPMSFIGQLMTQFKKMGYQATKSVWDSMAANPKVNIPLWLAVSQIGGELTGDTKALLRGLWKGTSEEDIAKRGDWWLGESGISGPAIEELSQASGIPAEVIARMVDNFTQYFFLGLPADLLMSSSYGPAGLATAAFGPVISDISKFANQIFSGNVEGIEKDILKSLPLPGSAGLADAVMED